MADEGRGPIACGMTLRRKCRETEMPDVHSVTEHVSIWPRLPLASWSATAPTLHMWTQIVGKIRLALSPHVNHWWQVPLYVSARGLTTSAMPYKGKQLEIE